jgi:hypothetical protein
LCVKGGSKSVLADRDNKVVYRLDNTGQGKAREFAGQKVKVTGRVTSRTDPCDGNRSGWLSELAFWPEGSIDSHGLNALLQRRKPDRLRRNSAVQSGGRLKQAIIAACEIVCRASDVFF